jgi:hypothetical protein
LEAVEELTALFPEGSSKELSQTLLKQKVMDF